MNRKPIILVLSIIREDERTRDTAEWSYILKIGSKFTMCVCVCVCVRHHFRIMDFKNPFTLFHNMFLHFLATRLWPTKCVPCCYCNLPRILCMGPIDNSNVNCKYCWTGSLFIRAKEKCLSICSQGHMSKYVLESSSWQQFKTV